MRSFLIKILPFILCCLIGPAFAETPPAAGPETDHVHLWKESRVLGNTHIYICEACQKKQSVSFFADCGLKGIHLISEFDGRGGVPVELPFSVSSPVEDLSVSYQWYLCESPDGSPRHPVPGSDDSVYRTEPFPEPEVRFYLCEATVQFSLDRQPLTAIILSDVYRVAYTGLPTVYIDTGPESPEEIDRYAYSDASFRLVPGPNDSFGPLSAGILIKGRGNFTWTLPKKGYTFRFEKKADPAGMGKAKKWALIANHADKSLLRNWYASILASEVLAGKDWSPKYEYVDLVLNQTYAGNYCLVSPVTISSSRIDIQPVDRIEEDLDGDGQLTPADGGYILEMDKRDDAPVHFLTAHNMHLSFYDPELEDAPAETVEWLKARIQETETVLYSKKGTGPKGGVEHYLDIGSFVNGYLVNEITKNLDSLFFSVFLYFDPGEQLFHLGPVWDFDLSCGNADEYNETAELAIQKAKWIRPLFRHPVFTEALRKKWQEIRDGLLSSVQDRIPAQAERIRISAELNNLQWPISTERYTGLEEDLTKRTTWEEEVHYLTDWLTERISWMDEQMANP